MSDPVVVVLGVEGAAELAASFAEILERSHRFAVRRITLAEASASGDGEVVAQAAAAADARLVALALPRLAATGAELLRTLRESNPEVPALAVMEGGGADEICELLRLGACDFITPPLDDAQVLPRVWRAIEGTGEREGLKRRLKERLGLRQLVGENAAFREEIRKIHLVARWDASVLICGETGTGKDLCGRAIHYLSPRAGKPFLPVNCGAIPAELVENELFGHERAAFTGASAPAPGLIQEAEGGTLFLDEIDSLPPAAQVKLLRFLQEKEYRPLGSTRMRKADVRVVAATNADPDRAVEQGKLRRDLFYRLNVLQLRMPPLRERRDDVPLLAGHFLARFNRELGRAIPGFTPQALQALMQHDWPGNVRELAHLIERAVVLTEAEGPLRREHLGLPGPAVPAPAPEGFREAKARMVAEFERTYVQSLLAAHRGNVTRAAQAARKDRKSFWELIRNHRIDVESFRR